jgi:hypothetical protein
MQPIKANPVPFMDQDRGVVVNTLSRLDIWSVGAFSLVCKDWKQLLESDYYSGKLSLWQAVALSQFPSMDLERIPDFRAYLRIDSNFTNGMYSKKCLVGARNPIIVKGDLLFSAKAECEAGQILKWDWKTLECTGVYQGHTAKIASIALSENAEHLFSRDRRGTVKKWDTEKCTCLATSEDKGYSGSNLVLASDNRFFTTSTGGSIKVWNAASFDHIETIASPKDYISHVTSWAVDTNKRRLVCGYSDGRIIVLDLDNLSSCIATHKDYCHIYPMILKGSKVFFGCEPGYHGLVKSWDYEKNSATVVLGRHGRWGRPMAVNETAGMLFSGFDCGFTCLRICRIDDLEATRGSNSALIRTHDWRMKELLEKDGVVFSASSKKVKILDFTETERVILEEMADAMMRERISTEQQDMENDGEGVLIKEDTEGKHGGVWEEAGGDGSAHDSESCCSCSEDGGWPLVTRQLLRLPSTTQEAIFTRLHEILEQDDPDYNGNPVDAFYHENGQRSTPAQRSEAIREFLGGQMTYSDDQMAYSNNSGSGNEQEWSEEDLPFENPFS